MPPRQNEKTDHINNIALAAKRPRLESTKKKIITGGYPTGILQFMNITGNFMTTINEKEKVTLPRQHVLARRNYGFRAAAFEDVMLLGSIISKIAQQNLFQLQRLLTPSSIDEHQLLKESERAKGGELREGVCR